MIRCVIFFLWGGLVASQHAAAQSVDELTTQGLALAREGYFGESMRYYNRALTIDPSAAKTYFHRANAKYQLNDYEGALADCARALELDSTLIDVYFNLALCHYYLEDYNGAVLDLNAALRARPDDHEALFWRGQIMHRLNRRPQACRDWERAAKLGNPRAKEKHQKYCLEENGVDIRKD